MNTRTRFIAAHTLTGAVFLTSAPFAAATNKDDVYGRAGGSDSHIVIWVVVGAAVLVGLSLLFRRLTGRARTARAPRHSVGAPGARGQLTTVDAVEADTRPADIDDADRLSGAGSHRVLVGSRISHT